MSATAGSGPPDRPVRPDGGSGLGATYAELMTIAGAHVRIATSQLITDAIATREDAEHSVRMARELVHALAGQARVLIGPASSTRAVLDSAHPDPVSLAAARFSQMLDQAVLRRQAQPELVSAASLARHYKNAAVAVRTATDLLLTQVDIYGRYRSPDAHQLLSPSGRIVALDDVAKLAIQLAETRQTLHEQVRAHASMRHPIEPVPELLAVHATARDVRATAARVLADDPSLLQVSWLQAVPSRRASMPVRTPDPLDELRVRMDRLRLSAWRLASGEGGVPVTQQALAAFAATGVAVNTAALVVGARMTGLDARDEALPAALQARSTKVLAWRSVRQQLLKVHTTAPDERAITADVGSTLRLVKRMVPAERGTGVLGQHELEPRVYAALSHSAEVMDQIAGWNSRALSRAARDLYVPGRTLSGDQVTDHPELVTAKLANIHVPAPKGTVEALREQYRLAAAPVVAAGGPPGIGPAPGIGPPGR